MAEIFHLLNIKTEPALVFNSLTSQKGLSSWWTTETKAVDEVGTVIDFSFGDEYFVQMQIERLVPDELVSWKCITGDKEWINTQIRFELSKSENGTSLRFYHSKWAEATDFFASCNYNWGWYLTSLKEYCETGKGKPFQSR